MRFIQKLLYTTLVAGTIASAAGAITGYASLIPEGVKLETAEENKDKILNNYVSSDKFYKDYITLQSELNNKRELGLISTGEMIKILNEFSSEEAVSLSLLSSNSSIAQAYKKALKDYEDVQQRIVAKSLIGSGCAIPALLGCAALETKINKQSKDNSKTNKNEEEHTK